MAKAYSFGVELDRLSSLPTAVSACIPVESLKRAQLPLVNNAGGNQVYEVEYLHDGSSDIQKHQVHTAYARDAWVATVRHVAVKMKAVAYQCISIKPVTGGEL